MRHLATSVPSGGFRNLRTDHIGGITGRVELQKALFPDGLVWSHRSGFLNSQNTKLMGDWSEYFQSLGDSRADLNNFLVLFGVPDGI